MGQSSVFRVSILCRLLLVACGVGLSAAVVAGQHDDNPQVRAALGQLLGDLERAAVPTRAAAAAAPGGRIRVQPGDTLDGIINRTMAGVPVQKSLLRRAFVTANPHAFPRGNANYMLAGATLVVPDITDLRRAVFTEDPRRQARPEDRRHWIRYP